MLRVLVLSDEPLTTLDIAEKTGLDRKRITDCMSRWHRNGYGYTKRLKTKRKQFHLYVISKKGIESYKKYDSRFKRGEGLSLKKSKAQKVDYVLNYFGINKSGLKLGLTINDIPGLAGLKRNLGKNGD